MSTFEDFLKVVMMHGHTQVRLVPRVAADGSIAFYAHGQCGPTSSENFKGTVVGNDIINMTQPTEPEAYITTEEADAFLLAELPNEGDDGYLSESEIEALVLANASVADVGEALDAEEDPLF